MDGLGGIMLSEVSQTQKDKYNTGSLTCGIKKYNKIVDITNKMPTHRARAQTSGYQGSADRIGID